MMEEIHIHTSDDKLKWWGYGEWVEEADAVNFEYEGLKCKIIRIAIPDGPGCYHVFGGYLCGYVSIPKDHPYFGKKWDAVDLDVHGGPTYFGNLNNDGEYWIGFDCCHSMDYFPSMEKFRKEMNIINDLLNKYDHLKNHPLFNPIYKNINFCIQECKSMAMQIKLINVLNISYEQ